MSQLPQRTKLELFASHCKLSLSLKITGKIETKNVCIAIRLQSRCRSRKKSEVFGWSRIP